MHYLIWNVDKARWCSRRPLRAGRANRLADALERRTGDHMIALAV